MVKAKTWNMNPIAPSNLKQILTLLGNYLLSVNIYSNAATHTQFL
jgi:hypothetical protein